MMEQKKEKDAINRNNNKNNNHSKIIIIKSIKNPNIVGQRPGHYEAPPANT